MLLKQILVILAIASPAAGYSDYTLDICPEPELHCSSVSMVSGQHPPIGGTSKITLDLDSHSGAQTELVYGVWFTVLYEGERGRFVGAGTHEPNPESTVSCQEELVDFVKPAGCPNCDTRLECIRIAQFDEPLPIEEDGEIWVEFEFDSHDGEDFTLHPGHFEVLDANEDTVMQGSMNSTTTIVPEPGPWTMLSAGIALLWGLERRRHGSR